VRCITGAEGDAMGQPVVHFEVVGRDGPALQSFYSQLFGWKLDTNNPMGYGVVFREENVNSDGVGIGGGVGQGPEGYPGHVTFYVEVPDVEAALAQAESLGGTRMMGPDEVMEGLVVGLFTDPEGHTIGLVKSG
jgi:predicted enzyme related to lactoylglutathione lyase